MDPSNIQAGPVARLLGQVLANEFALSTATRDYHWSVTGPHFRSMYELFDEQYHQIDRWMGRIVEGAHKLGLTLGTDWRALTETPQFIPAGGSSLTARNMIVALIALHGEVAEGLRKNIEGHAGELSHPVLHHLLSELLEYHETTSWMLSELLEDRELAQA